MRCFSATESVIEAFKQYGSAPEDVEDGLRTDRIMVLRQSGCAWVHAGSGSTPFLITCVYGALFVERLSMCPARRG